MPHPLIKLVADANYDDALTWVLSRNRAVDYLSLNDPTLRLRIACMSADVYDYGGLYSKAEVAISKEGERSFGRLCSIDNQFDLDPAELEHTKQECWATMMWGMVLYRKAPADYLEPWKRFDVARRVLTLLKLKLPCIGSLARAWYCIGLIHRQRKEYRDAKKAFGACVDLTGIGIKARQERGESTTAYDYNLARCYGLGLAWIAYDEANLADAQNSLVVANRLLDGKPVRFIQAYVKVIYAAAIMAGSLELAVIDRGIEALKEAYETLAPTKGQGHDAYALRAANELAQAYVRRARIQGRNANLDVAEHYLELVIPENGSPSAFLDSRTHAAALIIKSRILRGRGNHRDALSAAHNGMDVAGKLTFSLIDCYIAKGEALHALGEYPSAIAEFNEALVIGHNSRKITAVCRLHLAKAYLASHQPAKALDNFSHWERIEPDIENAFIRDIARQIGAALELKRGDFHISKDTDLDPKKLLWELRKWMAETAMVRVQDERPRAAKILDIGVPVLNQWLRGQE